MRINHNISSMITQGALNQVSQSMQTSLQRLSTGLRINSAADDAAGLGISENLRAQTTGMQQALKNTQDAISMLNIADGALNEQSSILQRMRQLVIQAKNDTYTSVERGYMYQEFNSDMQELDRIASVTNYNNMKLFAAPGDPGSDVYAVNTAGNPPNEQEYGRDAFANPSEGIFGANEYSSSNTFNMMVGQNYTALDATAYNNTVVHGAAQNSYENSAPDLITIQFGQMDANGILNPSPNNGGDVYDLMDSFTLDVNSPTNDDFVIDQDVSTNGYTPGDGANGKKLDLILNIIDGNPIDPTLDGDLFNGRNDTTGIKRVNEMRAYVGAMTNQLQHVANNLMTGATNTQAAESDIRDVDFAKETSTFTKNQILVQSATAMLAQANSMPQSVLQLLK